MKRRIMYYLLSILLMASVCHGFNIMNDNGSSTFLTLTDTPDTYVAAGGQCVVVNAGATALEFALCSGSGQVYPDAGVPLSTGVAWGTSYSTDGTGDCAAGAICLGNHTHSSYLTAVASDADWTVHGSYPAACPAGQYVTTIGDILTCDTPTGGSGDVVGPAVSVDNTIARYDSTTGKLLQGSGIVIDDSDAMTFNNAAAPSILSIAATSTVPTVVPNKADLDTGIGWAAANALSLVSGATEGLRITQTPIGAGQTVASLTHTKTAVLGKDTTDETAYYLPYTTNKLTSGIDYGLLINWTDTLSPATVSYPFDVQKGGTSILCVDGTNSRVGIGTISPDQILHAEKASALTATVQPIARFTHTTSGTPANNIGVGLEFEQETSANNNEIIATIEAVVTDVTSTSEDADLVFKTMTAGAVAAEKARITSLGVLVMQGGISLPIITKVFADSGYTTGAADSTILCDCTNGAITINLPTAVGITGRLYYIKKIDTTANAVTVDASTTETIDGALTLTIVYPQDCYTIQSDGANWRII